MEKKISTTVAIKHFAGETLAILFIIKSVFSIFIETSRPTTSFDARRSPKEEKEKVLIDPNNDTAGHWLTYPNPKTPQYLIDIKQRLGQLKIPLSLARSASVSNVSADRPESSVSHRQQQSTEQRHLFDFNLPQTPNELRAARHRLEKHRYNPSLDNYPARPQTCPVRTTDDQKPVTPPLPVALESEQEQVPPTESTKEDLWTANEENEPTENEAPSVMVQMVDADDLPKEYVEALEIANAAQIEYLKNFKPNDDQKPENLVYRLPSLPADNKSESFVSKLEFPQSINRFQFD